MMPTLMELAALLVASGLLLQAGRSLLTGIRHRKMVAREETTALRSFREATTELLTQAQTGKIPEAGSWSGFRKFYIHKRANEADGITSFYLRPYDGKPVPRYLPGQHLTFRLQIPGNPKPVVRCYSLSDAPIHDNQYRVSIKRLGAPPGSAGIPDGVGSCFFHDVLEVDRIVDVKAPGGNFYLDMTDRRPVVLIAGGIGLTPMLSMANTIAYTKNRREVWLFYAVQNRHQHVMPGHLKRLAREHSNIHVVICYAEPTRDCVKGRDFHYRGRINRRLFQGLLPSKDCQFYMCGPPPMQDALIEDLRAWGVAEKDIKWESFGKRKGKKPAAPAVGDNVARVEAIEIVFARSGKVGKWTSEDETVLDVAEAAGVAMDSGCRAGQCGTCVTAIKQGSVRYLEEPGTQPLPGTCLACMAIPKEGLGSRRVTT
ncbi:MAG: 2Fe-2S iron-sulfur cluster binding domain-containing protein [Rhodospirillaceae bacterium]|nr:2Fe-2S iron-sulfur cluster binding domain-containing protein [Rhodospirillaceae bacterium]